VQAVRFGRVTADKTGADKAEVLTAAAGLLHNIKAEPEVRYIGGYSGLLQKKRMRVRRVTRAQVPEGEESSELDAALDGLDPLAARHNTRDPDHEKTMVVVRNLPRAEALYRRALAVHPGRVDATLGLCALLQEEGKEPAEIRALYRCALDASGGQEVCVLVSLAEYEGKVVGDVGEALRLYRCVMALREPAILRALEGGGWEGVGGGAGASGETGSVRGLRGEIGEREQGADLWDAGCGKAEEEEGEMDEEDRAMAVMEALCGYAEMLIDADEADGHGAAGDERGVGGGEGAGGDSRSSRMEEAQLLLEHAMRLQPDCERAAVALAECRVRRAVSWGWQGAWFGLRRNVWSDGLPSEEEGLVFLEEWLGWKAFEDQVRAADMTAERAKANSHGRGRGRGRDRGGGRGKRDRTDGAAEAEWGNVDEGQAMSCTGNGCNIDVMQGGFGGWVGVGHGSVYRQVLRRPWALDASVAVCRRRVAADVSRGETGEGRGVTGLWRLLSVGSNRGVLMGASAGGTQGEAGADGSRNRWRCEEVMLRGVLAEQPRHIGALVVLAQVHELRGRWGLAGDVGGPDGAKGGDGATSRVRERTNYDHNALLLYKRAYRVCPRAMGSAALERYALLLERVEGIGYGRRARWEREGADDAGMQQHGISRKRALANQPSPAVIRMLADSLRKRPSGGSLWVGGCCAQ
jgi:hypothetical protein